jgi:DNA invertase Pin-like site-specific DNA recombinase
VIDDPSIDTSSRTGKLVMGILALIAEFENDIRMALPRHENAA